MTLSLEADKRLLKVTHQHVATLPFEKLDVLVVDETGKNISGAGMDLNVIGTWRLKKGERKPDYYRIVALSLTRNRWVMVWVSDWLISPPTVLRRLTIRQRLT